MNAKHNIWPLVLALVGILAAVPVRAAEGETLQNPALQRFMTTFLRSQLN